MYMFSPTLTLTAGDVSYQAASCMEKYKWRYSGNATVTKHSQKKERWGTNELKPVLLTRKGTFVNTKGLGDLLSWMPQIQSFTFLNLLDWLKPTYMWSFYGMGNDRLCGGSGSHDQHGHHAHIWINPLKIFFLGTERPMTLKLDMQHLGLL